MTHTQRLTQVRFVTNHTTGKHTTSEANVPGNHYYFKVAAYNTNGLVDSESAGYTIGEKPDTP